MTIKSLSSLTRTSRHLFAIILFTGALCAEPQVRYSPFWTSDADCITTVHLRNILVDSPITVTPVLHLEDGTPLTLGTITLPESGSTEIPVNSTVQALGYSAEQYGGAEFHFEAGWPGALAVETEVVMPEENLAYSVQSFARHDRNSNEQHAVFRLPTEKSEVYFAMYNSSDETVTVSPAIQSGNRSIALDTVRMPPHGFSRTSLHRNDIRGGLKDVGGVTLRHSGPAGALFTTGWLDDDETGFSTMMTFEELGQSHTRTELFGAQIFTSYVRSDIVLKNMSAGMVTAIAEFYPVQNGAVGTATFNIGTIQAGGYSPSISGNSRRGDCCQEQWTSFRCGFATRGSPER